MLKLHVATILHRIRRRIKPMPKYRWHNIEHCVSYVTDERTTPQGTVLSVIIYDNGRDRRGNVLIPKDGSKNIIKVTR